MRLPIKEENEEIGLPPIDPSGQSSFEPDNQLIIAFDFGTTFSGVAYAFKSNDKPEVISIIDWPGMLTPFHKH